MTVEHSHFKHRQGAQLEGRSKSSLRSLIDWQRVEDEPKVSSDKTEFTRDPKEDKHYAKGSVG